MPTLTIRNIAPEVHQALREQAAAHGRSMEAEVRALLSDHTGAAQSKEDGAAFYDRLRARFAGVESDLDLPERCGPRDAPDFGPAG